jgi:hypothetical protein
MMQTSINVSHRPSWSSVANSAFGFALAVGALTTGQAKAGGLVTVNVGGQDWDVTTFTGSYNNNKIKFALPSSPGGVMPWWKNESLASQFASAVGHSLGTQVHNGIKPENVGKIGIFFGYDASIDGKTLSFDYSFALRDGTLEVRQNSGPNLGIENTIWAQAALVATPGPLPALGVAAAFGYSRKLRKRIKSSANPVSSGYTI